MLLCYELCTHIHTLLITFVYFSTLKKCHLVLFSLYNIIRIRAFDKLVLLSGKKVRGNIIPESIRFFIKKKKKNPTRC